MTPNLLVTFDASVRITIAVNAHGNDAAYFAAAFNANTALRAHSDIVEPLAQRGIAIPRLDPTKLVAVQPLDESNPT